MPTPSIPQFPQAPDDPAADVEVIIGYLYDLDAYLNEGDPGGVWSLAGILQSRTLTGDDNLAEVINTLGTLIAVLRDKGIL